MVVGDDHGVEARNAVESLVRAVEHLRRQFPGDTEIYGPGGELNTWVLALSSVQWALGGVQSALGITSGDAARYEVEYFANRIMSGEWK